MTTIIYSKRVSEDFNVEFDFRGDARFLEVLSTPVTSISVSSGFDNSPSAALSGAPTLSNGILRQKVIDGLAGVTYILQATVSGSTGTVYSKTAYIAIKSDVDSFAPVSLPILTGVLPGATVPTPYSANLAISGGYLPYTPVGIIPGAPSWMGFTVVGNNLVCAGTPNETVTTNYTFTPQITDAALNVASDPQTFTSTVPPPPPLFTPMYLAVGNQLNLQKSIDGGLTWNPTANTGVIASATNTVDAAGGKLYHWSATASTVVSSDGTNFSATSGLSGFSASLQRAIKTGTEYQLYTDNGVDYFYFSAAGTSFAARTFTSGNVRQPVLSGTQILGIVGNVANTFAISNNSGTTFTSYSEAAFNSSSGLQRIVKALNGDWLAFGRNTTPALLIGRSSTGAGGSWSTTLGPATSFCVGARVAPSGRILIALGTGATYYSDDHGVSWNPGASFTMASPPLVSTVTATHSSFLYYANGAFFVIAPQVGSTRLYRSPDGVTPWTQVFTVSSQNITSITEF